MLRYLLSFLCRIGSRFLCSHFSFVFFVFEKEDQPQAPPDGVSELEMHTRRFSVAGERFAVLSFPVEFRSSAALSDAERDVLHLLLGGLSNLEIAKHRRSAISARRFDFADPCQLRHFYLIGHQTVTIARRTSLPFVPTVCRRPTKSLMISRWPYRHSAACQAVAHFERLADYSAIGRFALGDHLID